APDPGDAVAADAVHRRAPGGPRPGARPARAEPRRGHRALALPRLRHDRGGRQAGAGAVHDDPRRRPRARIDGARGARPAPAPAGIASALALRSLLGRTKAAAPIATFGTITRPENRAMTRILDIDVEEIKGPAIDEYDMVAMVDAQPSFFEEPFGEVDLVIDHHPEETPARARLRDIRPSWGATSTIMTEYLRAADVKITQRLATALLYGIMTDTLHLERGAIKADLEAFAYLHQLANHAALRRIERPELPNEALDVLAL